MLKLIAVFCLAIMLLPITVHAESVAQGIGDIITGNDSTYANIEAVKRFELERPIVGIDEVQIGAYFFAEISEKAGTERVYVGGPKVKLIW